MPLHGSPEENAWGRVKVNTVLWPPLLSIGRPSCWAVRTCGNHVTALDLSFLTCQIKMRIILTSQAVVRFK